MAARSGSPRGTNTAGTDADADMDVDTANAPTTTSKTDRPVDAHADRAEDHDPAPPVRRGRPRGPRRSREERREELLDAAERAIRRIGPQASMEELAAEAGITKPILYSHFGD